MTRRRGAVAAAAILVAAALAWLGVSYAEHRELDRLRVSALESATTYTEGLATYDFDDPDANLDRVTSTSTEEFAGTYREVSASLQDLLTSGQGQATGHVTAAGIVELDDSNAVVAVFPDQQVRNLTVPDGRTDSSRMLIGLARVDDRWLLDSAEPK